MTRVLPKVLLLASVLLLTSFGCGLFGHFVYSLYRMRVYGDPLEAQLLAAVAFSRALAPLFLLGILFLAAYVASTLLRNGKKTRS